MIIFYSPGYNFPIVHCLSVALPVSVLDSLVSRPFVALLHKSTLCLHCVVCVRACMWERKLGTQCIFVVVQFIQQGSSRFRPNGGKAHQHLFLPHETTWLLSSPRSLALYLCVFLLQEKGVRLGHFLLFSSSSHWPLGISQPQTPWCISSFDLSHSLHTHTLYNFLFYVSVLVHV